MQVQILELNSPVLLSEAPVWINKLPCCVQAGFPSPAEDHLVQRVDLMTQLIRHPQATYLLRVRGESMRDTERLYRYSNENLYAVDFDERLKKVAKTMMIIAGDGKANVIGTSSLDVREWQNSEARTRIGEFSKDVRDGDFDLVLTNPGVSGFLCVRRFGC